MNEFSSLIDLARESISSFFNKSTVDLTKYSEYDEHSGVFVTLYKNGNLRGCVGYLAVKLPLYDSIYRLARDAAFNDQRFDPLTVDELNDLTIEISILTKPERILVKRSADYLSKIEIGQDGLIVENSGRSGVLLPHVFVENNCDALQAIEMTCQKAGLHAHAWKDTDTNISKFKSKIIKEKK